MEILPFIISYIYCFARLNFGNKKGVGGVAGGKHACYCCLISVDYNLFEWELADIAFVFGIQYLFCFGIAYSFVIWIVTGQKSNKRVFRKWFNLVHTSQDVSFHHCFWFLREELLQVLRTSFWILRLNFDGEDRKSVV